MAIVMMRMIQRVFGVALMTGPRVMHESQPALVLVLLLLCRAWPFLRPLGKLLAA